jgi:hypothetical protein
MHSLLPIHHNRPNQTEKFGSVYSVLHQTLTVSCVDDEVFRVTVSCANMANALVARGQVRLVGSVLTPFPSLNSAKIVVAANPCLRSGRCRNGPFSNSKLGSLLGPVPDFNAISRLQSPTYCNIPKFQSKVWNPNLLTLPPLFFISP